MQILGLRQRTRHVLGELSRLPTRQRAAPSAPPSTDDPFGTSRRPSAPARKAVNALTHRGRTTMHQRVDASV